MLISRRTWAEWQRTELWLAPCNETVCDDNDDDDDDSSTFRDRVAAASVIAM